MALTDLANQYVDSVKPWELARQAGRESELQAACSNALNLFRLFAILLKPVLPALSRQGRGLPQRRPVCLGGRRLRSSPPGMRSMPTGTC
jgi:hypothetical protein